MVNPTSSTEAAQPPEHPPVALVGFLQPTPNALRNGRRTLAIFAIFVAVMLVLVGFVPGFGDPQTLAVATTTCVALAGDGIAYLGQPTVTRYRLGLIVTTLAAVAGFYVVLANPFA